MFRGSETSEHGAGERARSNTRNDPLWVRFGPHRVCLSSEKTSSDFVGDCSKRTPVSDACNSAGMMSTRDVERPVV